MIEPTYSTGQVALYCGVSISTVAKWIDSGTLTGHRLSAGHRPARRVYKSHLLRFMKQQGFAIPRELQEVSPRSDLAE